MGFRVGCRCTITLANLAYNMQRLIFHERGAAAG